MTAFLRHEKGILQELLFETASDEVGSSHNDKDIDTDMNNDTGKGHDKDSAVASGSQVHTWSRTQDTRNSSGVNPFTGSIQWIKDTGCASYE